MFRMYSRVQRHLLSAPEIILPGDLDMLLPAGCLLSYSFSPISDHSFWNCLCQSSSSSYRCWSPPWVLMQLRYYCDSFGIHLLQEQFPLTVYMLFHITLSTESDLSGDCHIAVPSTATTQCLCVLPVGYAGDHQLFCFMLPPFHWDRDKGPGVNELVFKIP